MQVRDSGDLFILFFLRLLLLFGLLFFLPLLLVFARLLVLVGQFLFFLLFCLLFVLLFNNLDLSIKLLLLLGGSGLGLVNYWGAEPPILEMAATDREEVLFDPLACFCLPWIAPLYFVVRRDKHCSGRLVADVAGLGGRFGYGA